MAWVRLFIVLAWLPRMTWQTSVLALWVCSSVLLPSLRNSHLTRKEPLKAQRLLQPRMLHKKQCLSWGKRSRRVLRKRLVGCIPFGRAHVNAMCASSRQWAHRQLLAAAAWMCPAREHNTRDVKGWSRRTRLVGEGCIPWAKPHIISSFAH